MTELSSIQKNEILFITLVQQYQMQAWISLGIIKNPASDKMERNLEFAKLTIDMLDMLQQKTKGNLSENEMKLLDQTLSDLKLNYISAANKGQESPAARERT